MNTFIIKQENKFLEVQSETLTIECLSHQYLSVQGKQVVVIDEPLADIKLIGESHKKENL